VAQPSVTAQPLASAQPLVTAQPLESAQPAIEFTPTRGVNEAQPRSRGVKLVPRATGVSALPQTHQEALTVAARVAPGQLASLQAVLRQLQSDQLQSDSGNGLIPFAKLKGCHFARLFTWEATHDLEGAALPAQLLLLSECDGSAQAHLEELLAVAADGLDVVFGHCEGYPRAPVSSAARLAFFKSRRVRELAHYVHRPGRSVQQVLGEAEVRSSVQKFVDQGKRWNGVAARDLRERIREYLRQQPELSWALEPPAGVDRAYRIREEFDRWLRPLAVLAQSPLLAPLGALALLVIRAREKRDAAPHVRPAPEHLAALTEVEDWAAHNAYAAGGFVKAGLLRYTVLRSVLKLTDYGVRHLFTSGSLAGVLTIHCARWIPLDEGRRVIFVSNFDGSVESYNDDFINLLGWGLNLVFSNGHGYPRTRWLVFGGAYREQEFKDYLRCHQIPCPVAYAAYPKLTARTVERNTQFRAGLAGEMSEEEAQAWLQLL
jgi:hypothetical protein